MISVGNDHFKPLCAGLWSAWCTTGWASTWAVCPATSSSTSCTPTSRRPCPTSSVSSSSSASAVVLCTSSPCSLVAGPVWPWSSLSSMAMIVSRLPCLLFHLAPSLSLSFLWARFCDNVYLLFTRPKSKWHRLIKYYHLSVFLMGATMCIELCHWLIMPSSALSVTVELTVSTTSLNWRYSLRRCCRLSFCLHRDVWQRTSTKRWKLRTISLLTDSQNSSRVSVFTSWGLSQRHLSYRNCLLVSISNEWLYLGPSAFTDLLPL